MIGVGIPLLLLSLEDEDPDIGLLCIKEGEIGWGDVGGVDVVTTGVCSSNSSEIAFSSLTIYIYIYIY